MTIFHTLAYWLVLFTGNSVLFTDARRLTNGKFSSQTAQKLLDTTENTGVQLFFRPSNLPFTETKLDAIYNPRPSVYTGFGEISWQGPPMAGTDITNEGWQAVFKYARDNDLVVMIHPTFEMVSGFETMLSNYPEVKVIAHGGNMYLNQEAGQGVEEWGNKVKELLETYDQLYWQLDVGSMLAGVVNRDMTTSQFLTWYENNKERLLKTYERGAGPIIQTAPKRILWGTDIAKNWNLNPQVYSKFMDFSRDIKKIFPEEHRDDYAYKNAKRLLGPGLNFKEQQ